MRKKRIIYWAANIGGWFTYLVLSGLITQMEGQLNSEMVRTLVSAFFVGVLLSHGYRETLIRLGWIPLSIPSLIPRVLIGSGLFGVVFFFTHTLLNYLLTAGSTPLFQNLTFFDSIQLIINWSLLCFLWSAVYFAYQYFERSRQQEIQNLKWEAMQNEMELNNLKSQLNPHFMFNSMNSILALIDENPDLAKKSLTRLSTILRSTLMLGKKKLITLKEELNLVNTFLALEKIRYEHRLEIEQDIDEKTLPCQVPPLTLQTLVENGIKHGISQTPAGGTLHIRSWMEKEGELLKMEIRNPGSLRKGKKETSTGTGLENTQKRLTLLFGNEASIRIFEEEGEVVTGLCIPQKKLPHEGQDTLGR